MSSIEEVNNWIDKILKERVKGAKKEYFVSFVGFDKRFNQWVSDIV